MKKLLIGMLAGAALSTAAFADGTQKASTPNLSKVSVPALANAACKRATKCSRKKYPSTGTVVWTISVKR